MTTEKIDIVTTHLKKQSVLEYDNQLNNPYIVANVVKDLIGDRTTEHFVVIGLDTKLKPTVIQINSIGTFSQTAVDIADIMRTLLLSNSVRFMVAHNHPSGDLTPSEADIKVTKKIIKSGKLLDIKLMDHLIVNHDTHYSMATEKTVNF